MSLQCLLVEGNGNNFKVNCILSVMIGKDIRSS